MGATTYRVRASNSAPKPYQCMPKHDFRLRSTSSADGALGRATNAQLRRSELTGRGSSAWLCASVRSVPLLGLIGVRKSRVVNHAEA